MSKHDDLPPFHDDLLRRVRLELHGLFYVFRFHGNNNHIRKAVTIFFIIVWGIVTVAITITPEHSVSPPFYGAFTGIVFLIMGRLWDLELNNVTEIGMVETEDSDE